MKLLPILLLNIVTVGAGIVVYDQVKGDSSSGGEYGMLQADTSDLEARIGKLERVKQSNAPMLESDDGMERLAARIDELEAKLAKAPTRVIEATEESTGTTASTDTSLPSMEDVPEPSPEAVAKYRKLQDAARKQERLERERKRIDETLARLEIDLSDTQRTKLTNAYQKFQERRTEVFRSAMTKAREAREAGTEANWGEVMTEARNTVQQEFASEISSFIPSTDDAQKISEGLNSRGRGMMGGRRGR